MRDKQRSTEHSPGRAPCLAAFAAALAASCAPAPEELPPFAEVLVVVDTDLPVPRIAERLRVDLYQEDGTWFDSRDVAVDQPSDWATSFSVYSSDEKKDEVVIVRLRAYPADRVRDYRGERFQPRPSGAPSDPVVAVVGDGTPRLVQDGVDMTPAVEPEPHLAVDRLVRLRLRPGERGRVDVALVGACLGTMANIAGGATCIEREGENDPLVEEKQLGTDLGLPDTSKTVGQFGMTTECTAEPRPPGFKSNGTPLLDEEVCVSGGLVLLGSRELVGIGDYQAVPERAAIIPPLRVDRYEVSVGRFRDALGKGFKPIQKPVSYNVDVSFETLTSTMGVCTYSSVVLPMFPRETFPLSCITWRDARAFCQYEGGDLPTEAQWEYLAAFSGRTAETRFPWGQDDPDCDRVVYGRSTALGGLDCKNTKGLGPRAIETSEPGDVTPGFGLVGLGGSMREWVVDEAMPYDSVCWETAPHDDPRCGSDAPAGLHARRGSSWLNGTRLMLAAMRTEGADGSYPYDNIGFRCVRPGGP